MQFQVALPTGADAPLRPLFIAKSQIEGLIAACSAGRELPVVAMPSGTVQRGELIVTEPPLGREWMLYLTYLDALQGPWFERLSRLDRSRPLDGLIRWLKTRTGPLAVVQSPLDIAQTLATGVSVLQLQWLLEARLVEAGIDARIVEPDGLRITNGRLQFARDDAAVGAVVVWRSLPSELTARWAACGVEVWPGLDEASFDRRALPALALQPGSRYASAWLTSPPESETAAFVFKPFADPYVELPAAEAAGEGVFVRRMELPTARLPVLRDEKVEWLDYEIELGAIVLGGQCITAFARCVTHLESGRVETLSPVVLV